MSKTQSESKMTVSGFQSAALGAMASRAVTIRNSPTLTAGGTLIKTQASFVILTPDIDDGPFLCGVATKGLANTEIEAALENQGPLSPEHNSQSEVSTRFRHIRIFGIIAPNEDSTRTLWRYFEEVTKLGFSEADAGYQFWIYNLGAALSSGSTLEVTHADFVIFDRD